MKPFFRFLSFLGGLFVLVLVVITTAAVVARYLLGTPIQWTEEMSGLLMIWIVFLGAIGCEIEDSHLRIDVVTNLLNKAMQRGLDMVVGLASAGLLGWMAWLGYELAERAAMKKTQILRVSWFWLDIAVTVGAAAMAIVMLVRVVRLLGGRTGGDLT
ncbi:TRAP transporter small permease [Rhodobacteraceae bacterium]|nr:TRAP transporter small permease [Paracoccaceae bacterium]